ncbi:hypothetical protein GBAR_LOCUS15785 [Geodia barretti]|uniref:Uncharacterized protein n=1 Tax=Geodia barretti TaxID=519541 RepID=A0AA35SCQ3_GEOBA|nr:hypothetical protein GBAR_LOCUS15785 [Geodia barretti]
MQCAYNYTVCYVPFPFLTWFTVILHPVGKTCKPGSAFFHCCMLNCSLQRHCKNVISVISLFCLRLWLSYITPPHHFILRVFKVIFISFFRVSIFWGLQGRFLLGPSRHFSCHFTWGLKGLFFRGLQGLQLQFLSADVYGVFGKDTCLGSNQEREMRD